MPKGKQEHRSIFQKIPRSAQIPTTEEDREQRRSPETGRDVRKERSRDPEIGD